MNFFMFVIPPHRPPPISNMILWFSAWTICFFFNFKKNDWLIFVVLFFNFVDLIYLEFVYKNFHSKQRFTCYWLANMFLCVIFLSLSLFFFNFLCTFPLSLLCTSIQQPCTEFILTTKSNHRIFVTELWEQQYFG